MDLINDTTLGGVAVRDSSLLTTAERNALAERARDAERRRQRQEILKRAELLDHQIQNAARRRLQAWVEAARSESAACHVTWPLEERLRDLFEAKRRLCDLRGVLA